MPTSAPLPAAPSRPSASSNVTTSAPCRRQCRDHAHGAARRSVPAVPVALAPARRAAGRGRRPLPGSGSDRRPRHQRTTPQADPAPRSASSEDPPGLKQHSRIRLTTYYTPYPATIIGGTDGGGLATSKDAGIDATNARLKTVAQHCPTTSFLLSGYSQGADVAGDVAAAIGSSRGPSQPTASSASPWSPACPR